MRSLPLALLGLSLFTGCNRRLDAEPVIVFLQEFGDADTESDATCSESFNDADCPTSDGGGSDSPWTYTYDFDGTSGQYYIFIHDNGPKDNVVLISNGYTYEGTVTKGKAGGNSYIIDAERVAELDETDEREHEDGYRYSQHEVATTTVSWHLEIKKGQIENSTVKITVEDDTVVEETDEWEGDQIGVYYGEIEYDCYSYLDGDCDNYYDDDNCDGNLCRIQTVGTTTTTIPILRGIQVDQTFHDSLAGAGQGSGSAEF